MNGNPFTLGHRWLCEQASAEADIVYVLVVEEDGSMFSFADRLAMAKEGTADLKNVVVLGGGRYAVSLLTFPSYFTGDEKAAEAHTAVDSAVFMRYIAPALGVGVRYLGSEPFSPVTAIYNKTLKEELPSAGIEVRQLKRLEHEGAPISASRVRRLLSQEGGFAEDEMRLLVPETTMKYLRQRFESEKHLTLAELLDSRENRADHQKELLKKYGGTLISMTLNIPGPVKDRPEYRRTLREGMRQVKSALGQKIVYEEIRELITGPEGYLCTEMDGLEVKEKAVRVEEGSALGRLLDIDVLTAAGDDVQSISRSALGRPPRRCLLCGEDARVCARSRRHSMEELLEKIKEITGCFSL